MATDIRIRFFTKRMRKTLCAAKYASLFASFLTVLGCLNVMQRTMGAESFREPYLCTRCAAEVIAEPFAGYGEDEFHSLCCWCALPMCVDLPLEAVCDTLLLPIDWYVTATKEEREAARLAELKAKATARGAKPKFRKLSADEMRELRRKRMAAMKAKRGKVEGFSRPADHTPTTAPVTPTE